MTMERKIGEIFEYNGEWYQCVNGGCKDCDFSKNTFYCKYLIERDFCKAKSIFKKLEKVGESYMLKDKKFQKYRVFHTPYIYKKIDYSWQSFADPYYISLEIKQNKEDMEDMEEKKLNLKPFDLQKAKQGKPVCTRDGRKARIICFDLQSIEKTPIVAAVQVTDKQEVISHYYEDGRQFVDGISELDLMMLPEKKERWINIYRNEKGEYWSEQILFSTKKDATDFVHDHTYVTTVKVEWEE